MWKEYALNIELKLNRFTPVLKQEQAKLQEACYIKLLDRIISVNLKLLENVVENDLVEKIVTIMKPRMSKEIA